MAKSVLISIASAGIALAMTATIAIPSMAAAPVEPVAAPAQVAAPLSGPADGVLSKLDFGNDR